VTLGGSNGHMETDICVHHPQALYEEGCRRLSVQVEVAPDKQLLAGVDSLQESFDHRLHAGEGNRGNRLRVEECPRRGFVPYAATHEERLCELGQSQVGKRGCRPARGISPAGQFWLPAIQGIRKWNPLMHLRLVASGRAG
jgi:hypothetical protein